jgi:ribosomal subunit interface protein
MKVDIAAPRFTLTEGVREYVERRFSPLERFHPRLTRAVVVLDKAPRHCKRPFVVKAHTNLPSMTADATARGAEFHTTVDAAAEKLGAKLRKAHEKRCHQR